MSQYRLWDFFTPDDTIKLNAIEAAQPFIRGVYHGFNLEIGSLNGPGQILLSLTMEAISTLTTTGLLGVIRTRDGVLIIEDADLTDYLSVPNLAPSADRTDAVVVTYRYNQSTPNNLGIIQIREGTVGSGVPPTLGAYDHEIGYYILRSGAREIEAEDIWSVPRVRLSSKEEFIDYLSSLTTGRDHVGLRPILRSTVKLQPGSTDDRVSISEGHIWNDNDRIYALAEKTNAYNPTLDIGYDIRAISMGLVLSNRYTEDARDFSPIPVLVQGEQKALSFFDDAEYSTRIKVTTEQITDAVQAQASPGLTYLNYYELASGYITLEGANKRVYFSPALQPLIASGSNGLREFRGMEYEPSKSGVFDASSVGNDLGGWAQLDTYLEQSFEYLYASLKMTGEYEGRKECLPRLSFHMSGAFNMLRPIHLPSRTNIMCDGEVLVKYPDGKGLDFDGAYYKYSASKGATYDSCTVDGDQTEADGVTTQVMRVILARPRITIPYSVSGDFLYIYVDTPCAGLMDSLTVEISGLQIRLTHTDYLSRTYVSAWLDRATAGATLDADIDNRYLSAVLPPIAGVGAPVAGVYTVSDDEAYYRKKDPWEYRHLPHDVVVFDGESAAAGIEGVFLGYAKLTANRPEESHYILRVLVTIADLTTLDITSDTDVSVALVKELVFVTGPLRLASSEYLNPSDGGTTSMVYLSSSYFEKLIGTYMRMACMAVTIKDLVLSKEYSNKALASIGLFSFAPPCGSNGEFQTQYNKVNNLTIIQGRLSFYGLNCRIDHALFWGCKYLSLTGEGLTIGNMEGFDCTPSANWLISTDDSEFGRISMEGITMMLGGDGNTFYNFDKGTIIPNPLSTLVNNRFMHVSDVAVLDLTESGTDSQAVAQTFVKQLADTLIVPGTVELSFPTDPETASDDGDGNLTGDATGTINYATGEIYVSWAAPPTEQTNFAYDFHRSGTNRCTADVKRASGYDQFTGPDGTRIYFPPMNTIAYRVTITPRGYPRTANLFTSVVPGLTQTATLTKTPILPGSLTVVATSGVGNLTVTDDGNGHMYGDGTGTVNYVTGAVSITWTNTPLSMSFDYSYESSDLSDGRLGDIWVTDFTQVSCIVRNTGADQSGGVDTWPGNFDWVVTTDPRHEV